MRVCVLVSAVAGMAMAAGMAFAGTILVGTENDGGGGFIIGNEAYSCSCGPNDSDITMFGNAGVTQAFQLDVAVVADQLTVYVNSDLTNPASFTAYLTRTIGTSYSGADLLFAGTDSFGSYPTAGPGHVGVSFSLGSLMLGPGTYYLTLLADTPVSYVTTAQDATERSCVEAEPCGRWRWGPWTTLRRRD